MPLQLLCNVDCPIFQINIIPCEANDFPLPHSSKQRYQEQPAQRFICYRFDKQLCLLFVHRVDLCFLHLRQYANSSGIQFDVSYLNCLLQSLVDNSMQILYCFGGYSLFVVLLAV